MRWIGVLGVSLAMAGAASGARAEDTCAKAAPTLAGMACVATANGAAFAPDPARAAELAGYATSGEQRFQARFGRAATPYVVYEMTSADQPRQTNAALIGLGYRPLQWPSKQAQKDLITEATQDLATRMKAEGRPDAVVEQVVQRRLAGLDAAVQQREESVVPHELAHKWYVESGWPGVLGDTGGHYGGPGPDWMDELSALVVESDATADGRRNQFKDIYQVVRPELAKASRADLLDLPALLDQVHPANTGGLPTGTTTSLGSGAKMTVSTDPNGATSPITLFYLKDRMVADFLMAQSGDPAIFGSILDGFKRGQTFDDWLRTEGVRKNLAADRQGLDRQWRDWLKSKLGEPKLA